MTEPSTVESVTAYLYSTPSETCSFFFAEKGRWTHGDVASDAEFVCRQRKRDSEDELLIFCQGTYVEIDGRRVLSCKRKVTRCEMLIRKGRNEIYASEPEALLDE